MRGVFIVDNAKILEFYNKIFSDSAVKSKLTEIAKNIKNSEDLKKFIMAEIIPLAKKNGFDFSEEDLINYEYETLRELKAEDLYNVSGGTSFKSILMSGGILSALFLSVGLAPGQIADAVIDLKDVKESGTVMEQAIRESAQHNMQPQVNNPQNEAQAEDTNNSPNVTDSAEVNDNRNNPDNVANAPDNDNDNNNGTSVTLPKDVIESSANAFLKIAQNSKADINYVFDACNLFLPFIDCNFSGIMDTLRFENGYTEEITVGAPGGDGVAALEFNKHSGDGIPNLMTTLFPSSGGTLNITGGYSGSYPLYKTCNPTPGN